MLERTQKLFGLYSRNAHLLAPAALLIVRLAWGWELVESGYGHLTHLDQTTEFFNSLHISMPRANAVISGTTEMVGGTLWMLGLGTRIISVPLLFNFIVAYLTASHDKVAQFFRQDPSNFIDDTAFPFLVTSLLMIAFGAGPISLDALIKRFVPHLSKRPVENSLAAPALARA